MHTPIYEFLTRYAAQDPLRMHMPGHKGRGLGSALDAAFPLDITEIPGADSLFDAAGIIAESEANAAAWYHTAGTVYSTAGSTLCIQTMLALMQQEHRRVLAVRNVHRAFLTASVLLGLEVEWIYPTYTGGILSGTVTPAQIAAALDASPTPACVYVTSPDYLGHCADIAGIAAVCRAHQAPLLVDNAHGAHLGLFSPSRHPIALGADLCCDSAHKMLPALTGCAYLHTSQPRYAAWAKAAMSLFGSTSPSYLLLASLDLCNAYLAEHGAADLARVTAALTMLRQKLSDCWRFYPGEPLHLTICAAVWRERSWHKDWRGKGSSVSMQTGTLQSCFAAVPLHCRSFSACRMPSGGSPPFGDSPGSRSLFPCRYRSRYAPCGERHWGTMKPFPWRRRRTGSAPGCMCPVRRQSPLRSAESGSPGRA